MIEAGQAPDSFSEDGRGPDPNKKGGRDPAAFSFAFRSLASAQPRVLRSSALKRAFCSLSSEA
jgi:hypothetical protein